MESRAKKSLLDLPADVRELIMLQLEQVRQTEYQISALRQIGHQLEASVATIERNLSQMADTHPAHSENSHTLRDDEGPRLGRRMVDSSPLTNSYHESQAPLVPAPCLVRRRKRDPQGVTGRNMLWLVTTTPPLWKSQGIAGPAGGFEVH